MSQASYSLGLDFGTSSVRALIADVADGRQIATRSAPFECEVGGVITSAGEPHLARQNPLDWERSLQRAVCASLEAAREDASFSPDRVVGIGIDATASTPVPVDAHCRPLVESPRFAENLAAMAWLWKDHTAHTESEECTRAAQEHLPRHLERVGGTYSSEWYFSKLLRLARTAPEVLQAADGFLEEGDFIAASLTGCPSPREVLPNACAAGHKGLFHDELGFPPLSFFERLDTTMASWLRERPRTGVVCAGNRVGGLSPAWARRLGLRAGIPISAAAIDAHVGAVGAGVRPGRLAKIIGTSSCDMLVHPLDGPPLAPIRGLSGLVRESILPDHWGIEAGQAAVGDLFGWFVRGLGAGSTWTHQALTAAAAELRPGESGLLALDWHNGNRCVLADPRLSGILVGQTLATRPEEIYRALIEATAFGFRTIVERVASVGVTVDEIVVCGGIARKNPLLLSIYADVVGRPLQLAKSGETCALGAAIFGAVAAGAKGGGHDSIHDAQRAMAHLEDRVYRPSAEHREAYDALYALYRQIHDAFGGVSTSANLSRVMKDLFALRKRVRARR